MADGDQSDQDDSQGGVEQEEEGTTASSQRSNLFSTPNATSPFSMNPISTVHTPTPIINPSHPIMPGNINMPLVEGSNPNHSWISSGILNQNVTPFSVVSAFGAPSNLNTNSPAFSGVPAFDQSSNAVSNPQILRMPLNTQQHHQQQQQQQHQQQQQQQQQLPQQPRQHHHQRKDNVSTDDRPANSCISI